MVNLVELEGYVVGIYILCIVICEFGHEQKFCPVILLSIDKSIKISLYYDILPLGLAVFFTDKT